MLVAAAVVFGVLMGASPAASARATTAATARSLAPLLPPRSGARDALPPKLRLAGPRWAAVAGAGLAQQVTVVYAPPVEAPVIDRYRPPSNPYGPGNRGWEYATNPGTIVRAAADGVVTFAGRVGPSSAVTVAHADGLRTSYSYLVSVVVSEGVTVRRGDPVGLSGDRMHFGVRRGDLYLDPAGLFALPARVRVRLVPIATP